jgi:hypothetical protein
VSTQQEPARPAGDTEVPGGTRKVFRLPGPVALWWVWAVFVVANLVDLAIQGHDRTSLQISVGLLAITGGVYACALRPRVITGPDGVTVANPLRDYRVPWGRISEVHLGESLQVHCSPEPGASVPAAKVKVVHSWALYSPRRSRVRAEARGRRWDRSPAGRPGGYGRMPAEAREVAKQTSVELMAREIHGMASQARERGAAGGTVVARWAWSSLAAFGVPALVLALVIAIR